MAARLAASPVTIPVDEPIEAMVALVPALVHRPPGVASLSVMFCNLHTLDGPVIGASGFTVTVDKAVHPLPST